MTIPPGQARYPSTFPCNPRKAEWAIADGTLMLPAQSDRDTIVQAREITSAYRWFDSASGQHL